MASPAALSFPPFHLDLMEERLWRSGRPVRLRQKAFHVLRHLAEHPERVVTSEELLDTIWPGVSVSPIALKVCVREIRRALRDDARRSRFVRTIRGRGYQFIARSEAQEAPARRLRPAPRRRGQAWLSISEALFVGREEELARLEQAASTALSGTRQMVFVTGEPGIGKTTIVEAFLDRFASRTVRVLAGRCIQHYGTSEPYAPALEAIERLCRTDSSGAALTVLRKHAPAWLPHLSSLLDPAEREELARRPTATQERMLREIAVALEELSARNGVVLWLEDLHWSDPSTLDLISYLARRPDRARLLVIGTYRRTEVMTGDHPLTEIKRDLESHGLCAELALGFLRREDTTRYLSSRFDWTAPPEALVDLVHERTGGSPLFLVSVVNDLVSDGVVAEERGKWVLRADVEHASIPSNVRQLIEQQIARLDADERQVLEAASIAGFEFSAATAGAALEIEASRVEQTCEGLRRRESFLQGAGEEEWPDGTTASRYRFVHVLHREILNERLTAARKSGLHRQILLRKERAFGKRSNEIAAELSMHAEEARDRDRAVRYLGEAGERAARAYANRESVAYLDRALGWIGQQDESPERDAAEIGIRQALSVPLANTRGYAAPPLEENLVRLKDLAERMGDSAPQFPVTLGMWSLRLVRGELAMTLDLGKQLLVLARRAKSPLLLLQAHRALGHTHFYLGDFREAQRHLERALASYDVESHTGLGFAQGDDPIVLCLAYSSWTLWHLGETERAHEHSIRAVELARKLDQPPSLAFAIGFQAVLHQLAGNTEAALADAESLLELASDEGFLFWLAWGWILRGWAWTMQGRFEDGVAQIHHGLGTWQATGAELGRPYTFALLARALAAAGRAEAGLEALSEGLERVERTGERWHEAELHRLREELGRRRSDSSATRVES